ncbi:hypothetical protein K402DRAFT_217891 [Aulographum hederae CBS 113979]|uniref:Uncharacterized protein n=1 Tax=Aulographum hederae CBS 113979 TaxID=1176131 RepID=A0A6G1GLX1_9PEZI|nr:hypothetical protein K402DRAFT_217891 [Aulographum hederae CBS 113979]
MKYTLCIANGVNHLRRPGSTTFSMVMGWTDRTDQWMNRRYDCEFGNAEKSWRHHCGVALSSAFSTAVVGFLSFRHLTWRWMDSCYFHVLFACLYGEGGTFCSCSCDGI